MSRSILAAAVAGLVSLSVAAEALADPIDDVMRGYMEAAHIPGAAVAVVEDGRIVKLEGYGHADLEWQGAATGDTPFQTASVSKIFAGVVLMRLVEKGLVDLDEPITRWFEGAPESWNAITLRRLSGHTSGLAEAVGMPSSATPMEVAIEAMKRPLAYEPGAQSRYGLTDFIVMTAVLEKASGLTYPELLRREVVEPLGLTHTGVPMTAEAGPARSHALIPGRAQTYGFRDGEQRREDYLYPVHVYAAGGLYSSARDLATLMAALDRGELLSRESFALLTSPAKLADGSDGPFGVGWTFGRYRGETVVGHTGGPALADVMYVPDRHMTIVALTNQRRFYPLLSQAIADLTLPAPPPAPAIADARPEATAAFRDVLAASAEGRLEAARFTAKGAADSLPFYLDFGRGMLTAVGAIQAVDLLSERPQGELLRRLYRVKFERRTMLFAVLTDAEGRFEEIRPLQGDED